MPTAVVVAPVPYHLRFENPPLRRRQSLEDHPPAFPAAEASCQVLLRYGQRLPGGHDFIESKTTGVGFGPKKPEPWLMFVTGHRAVIEAERQALQSLRAWWDELNAFRPGREPSPRAG